MPQSRTADKPQATQGRATQPSQDPRQASFAPLLTFIECINKGGGHTRHELQ